MGRLSKPVASSQSRQFYFATPATSSYTISPPPLGHVGSPYASIPLPPVVEPPHRVTIVVHPYLAFSNVPPIVWDVSLPCGSIASIDRRFLTSQALSEPATNPPLSILTIISFQLPQPITVYASSPEAGAHVTVSDVLDTLNRALQVAVTPTEINLIPSREVKDRIRAAHASRTRGGNGQGVKRVDYLMGGNMFMGLSRTQFGPGVWALNVS